MDRAGQSFLPLPAACRPRADPFGFEPSLRRGTVSYPHAAWFAMPTRHSYPHAAQLSHAAWLAMPTRHSYPTRHGWLCPRGTVIPRGTVSYPTRHGWPNHTGSRPLRRPPLRRCSKHHARAVEHARALVLQRRAWMEHVALFHARLARLLVACFCCIAACSAAVPGRRCMRQALPR